MPVTAQETITVSTSNGVSLSYPYGFYLGKDTEIVVLVDGITMALSSDYIIDGLGNASGGNVNFFVAPATGAKVVCYRAMPHKRDTDYAENGDRLADTLDKDFDDIVRQIQQIHSHMKRAVKFPPDYIGNSVIPSSGREGKAIMFNSITGEMEVAFPDVTSVPVSEAATPSTIPIRDASGKVVGDITGNAATATTATTAETATTATTAETATTATTALSLQGKQGILSNLLAEISWKPQAVLQAIKTTFTGAAGENQFLSCAYDGTYIYVGTDTSPGKILKIDPATMVQVGSTFTGAAGENVFYSLVYLNGYLYATCTGTPGKVLKLSVDTLTKVGTFTGATGENDFTPLTHDGTYLYAGAYTSPLKVVKIDPATMLASGTTFTAAAGEATPQELVFDGAYLYAACATTPGKIVKINPATMTSGGTTFTAATGENNFYSLAYDGTYLYAGTNTSPGKIVKLNPSTMAAVGTTLTLATNYNIVEELVFDGMNIIAVCSTSPTILAKINRDTLTQGISFTFGTGEDLGRYAFTDGVYIFTACRMSSAVPGKLVKKVFK